MTSGKGVRAEVTDSDGSIGVPRPGWLPGTSEEDEGPTIEPDLLPSDDAFEILRNPRRRHALSILAGRDGEAELTDVANKVASIENEKPQAEVNAAERKRVYISLYQCHVSKMVEAGVIEYDEETRALEITPRGTGLAAVLESFGADSGGNALRFPAVTIVAFVLSVGAYYASAIAVAALFLGVGLSFSAFSYRCADDWIPNITS